MSDMLDVLKVMFFRRPRRRSERRERLRQWALSDAILFEERELEARIDKMISLIDELRAERDQRTAQVIEAQAQAQRYREVLEALIELDDKANDPNLGWLYCRYDLDEVVQRARAALGEEDQAS